MKISCSWPSNQPLHPDALPHAGERRRWSASMLLSLAFAAAVSAAPQLARIADYEARARQYASDASLSQLKSGGAEHELRVWQNGPFGLITGWVATESTVRVYTNAVLDTSGRITADPKGVRLLRELNQDMTETLEEHGRVTRFNGLGISCGQKDGVGYTFEGLFMGSYYAFAASNPAHCDSSDYRTIQDTVDTLRKIAPDAL